MHVLLPPSETKHPGGRGRPLRTRTATGPLTQPRARVLDALADLLAGDADAAAGALLLPAGVAAAALDTDRAVLDSRTTPALSRYAGVVYDGLAYATMTPAEQRLAARSTWIFSGLLGVVRGDEGVPDYRVPAKAVLPGVGVAGTFWRPVLDEVVPRLLRSGLVVDLRSGDYASMWRPKGRLATRVVPVRVLSPVPSGGHGVVSYTSKFAKGLLTAALVRRVLGGEPVDDVGDVAAAWLTCGGHGSEVRPDGGLDVVTA